MAVKFTFFYLLVVAATGVWMRTMPFLPDLGLPFENLRHAHSHLAFLGWVYAAFLLALSDAFLPTGAFEKPRFQQIFWLTQLSACCMFAAFLGQGYGPVSIGFLTLHTFLAYLFFGYFLKNARLPAGKASTLFTYAAIFSFIFSSFGPFAIPFITVLGDGNPVHLKMAVHFYLHFHYNGWFVFGLLALLLKTLENEGVAFSFRWAKWQFWLMFAGLFPAWFLMVPFFELPEFGTVLVKAGLMAQWLGMCIFAAAILRSRTMRFRVLRTPLKFLLGFSLAVLFLKFSVEMLTIFPVVFALVKSANHFLTIAWLHLLFLGSITPFLWWFFAKKGWGNWTGAVSKTGIGMFLTGFVFTELLLFATGLGYLIPSLPQWLLGSAALILGGIILLAPGIFTNKKLRRNAAGLRLLTNFKNMKPPKPNIETRADVSLLVRSFYEKIRQDEMLGPIFNSQIQDWEPHLEKLTDFWEGNLLFFVKTKFKGDPKIAHQRVDEASEHAINMEHFGRWINLWIETIDEHFEGENAGRAKMMARKMATFLFLKIFENRQKQSV